MLKHIFFIIHIIAFVIGIICILFSLLFYKRNKTVAEKHYALFLISLTIILFEQAITSYINVNQIQNTYLEIILKLSSSIGCGLTIYFGPVFVHSFFHRDMDKWAKNFFWVLANIPVVTILLYYTFPWRFVIILMDNLCLLISILYAIIKGFKYFNEAESEKKKIVKLYLILSVIALPLIFFDIFIERIPGIGFYFPYGILSLPLFYIAWNIISLKFAFEKFSSLFYSDGQPVSVLDKTSINEDGIDSFCRKFGITAREKEVVSILMKGYSYNKISEELVISLPTTKSHVQNIYKKVGVNNKFELMNQVKNSTEDNNPQIQ